MSATTLESVLLIETRQAACGKQLGILSLNRPQALNSLNAELIRALREQLQAWQQNDEIVAVWLQGNDKAFCAGGDIREVQQVSHHANSPEEAQHAASAFFKQEYGLYAYMAAYSKPIIAWCGGIVMGGGLGLTAASTVRIVTDTTLMAMPEISIGLFPDAGASFFLQRFPFKSGLFLGLTGARFHASDALLGNLAEYALSADTKEQAIEAVLSEVVADKPLEGIKRALLSLPEPTLPASTILQHQQAITSVVKQPNFQAAWQQLQAVANESPWLQEAAQYVQNGCATSAALHWQLMQRCRHLSLDEVLSIEHTVAVHCATSADFIEGVRALLIDKDKNPRWQKSAAEIDAAWLAPYFVPL